MNFDLHTLLKNKHKRILVLLCIVFFIGMLLILLDDTQEKENDEKITQPTISTPKDTYFSDYTEELEKRMEDKFSKIEGVGKVEVVLTIKTKGEIVLNKDMPYHVQSTNEQDTQGGTRISEDKEQQETTVLLDKGDGSQEAIVVKEYLPEISGVLIIAEGGDNIVVKSQLIEAARVLLDVPAHKIEVVKMVSE